MAAPPLPPGLFHPTLSHVLDFNATAVVIVGPGIFHAIAGLNLPARSLLFGMSAQDYNILCQMVADLGGVLAAQHLALRGLREEIGARDEVIAELKAEVLALQEEVKEGKKGFFKKLVKKFRK